MNHQQDIFHEESIDYKALIFKFFRYWWFFVITIPLSILIAFLINRYTTPIYNVNLTLLIQNEQSPVNPQFIIGLPFVSNQSNLEKEIKILKTYSLTKRTIEKLDFNVSYFNENKIPVKELYKKSPFVVAFDTFHPQPLNIKFYVYIISDDKFKIEAYGKNIPVYIFEKDEIIGEVKEIYLDNTFNIGEEIRNNNFCFRILLNDNFDPGVYTNIKLSFVFNNNSSLIKQFQSTEITANSNESTIAISHSGNNAQKSVDFLNILANVYLEKGIEKKNQIADKTINFIEEQLNKIKDSLNYSEQELEDFQSSNQVINMDYQIQKVYTNLENLQKQKAELIVESKYFKYLQEYLENNNDVQNLIAPTSMNISDPFLNNLINELTNLTAEKAEILLNSMQNNPLLTSIKLKLNNTKNTLIENLKNKIKTTNISINDIDSRISDVTTMVANLPNTRFELFGYQRKFNIHDALYTLLLTKLSEFQISKASFLPINEILDSARIKNQELISPKKKRNYFLAIFIGLVIPVGFIFIKDFFNDKISESKDVESLTNLPILGHIIHNKQESDWIVYNSPRSLISESFRSIWINFQYVTNVNEKQIILITSVMIGEGKTFTSINLASIFAFHEKKTILLSFDLRKPKIFSDLKFKNGHGLSSYLSDNCNLEDIIQPSPIKNFDVIVAGSIPPNPTELISSSKTKQLFIKLKEMYDYIIIDTPPVGFVSDAFILVNHSNVNVFIVRHNYTSKKIFSAIMDDIKKRKIPNVNIIINDIKLSKNGYGYSNGYYYGYGYGHEEITENKGSKIKSIYKRIFYQN